MVITCHTSAFWHIRLAAASKKLPVQAQLVLLAAATVEVAKWRSL